MFGILNFFYYLTNVKQKKNRIMDIKDVRNNLIKDLESEYTPTEIELIDIRLEEIAEMERMSLEDLDYYCTANSSEMFSCIFDYKEFKKENFNVD
jgi:hypothetical protein